MPTRLLTRLVLHLDHRSIGFQVVLATILCPPSEIDMKGVRGAVVRVETALPLVLLMNFADLS